MRIDLTVRSAAGGAHDVAVLAREGTTFGDLAGALSAVAPDARPEWSGSRRLDERALVGRRGLVDGAVLSPERGADDGCGGPRLCVVGGIESGRTVVIDRPELTIGRDSSCDLVLTDQFASRRHAELVRTPAGIELRDLGSTHGTWLDGVRIERPMPVSGAATIRVGTTFLALAGAAEPAAPVRDGPAGRTLVSRTALVRAEPPERTIEVPPPPRPEPSPRTQWVTALVPSLAGAALAWSMHSPQFLAFAALTPMALLAGAFGDRLHWRRSRRRAAADHRRVLARVENDLARALHSETQRRRRRDPDASAVARAAATPTVRLWERHRGAGLLRVRLGLGDLPSAVRVVCAGAPMPAGVLPAVPVVVDLATGPLLIAGPSVVAQAVARWLLAQLGVLCSPADVELVVVTSAPAAWHWARWLPHLRGRVAVTAIESETLAVEIAELVDMRAAGTRDGSPWTGPWLVVLLDQAAPGRGRWASVLAGGTGFGVTAICLTAHEHDGEIAGARTVLVAGQNAGAAHFTGPPGPLELVLDGVGARWADTVARRLAPLRDAAADASAALPDDCRLVDLIGGDQISVPAVRQWWRRSDGGARTVLGAAAQGPLELDLAGDGPHALIAGTTGSGKSELLQTLVTGLALRYPPDELTLLLIDYKGGAAFAQCAQLPHTVGLVTDLDDQLTARVLVSLTAEIRRRESLLAQSGARDVAAYRATGATLPRLVIVIDELATLADELPNFVPELVGVAQRGRSLGLHLVLATQRPTGVLAPEIRANTAIRICLRVASPAESIEIIDRVDAALIGRRTPGRAVLRIGTSTVAFQAARVAGAAARAPTRVQVLPLGAWRQLADTGCTGETDLVRLVPTIQQSAAGRAAPRRPWLPPLPSLLEADDLMTAPPTCAPIGMIDRPEQQRQEPLAVELSAGGAVLIVGSPGSGRTTTLVTLARAAATRLGPDELHLHGVDATGSALTELVALPHTGTIATTRAGFELGARLIDRLVSEFSRRRDGAADESAAPLLLLLVDGWDQLVSASEEFDSGRTAERLLGLLADAAPAHALIALTGGRAALSARLAAVVSTRLVLALHDPSDYAIAGVAPSAVPSTKTPGRGVRLSDGAHFQIARPAQAVPVWAAPRRAPLRLRVLPRTVHLSDVAAHPVAETGLLRLGLGGDYAAPITVDLHVGAGRLLVAGPAGSGRSTTLCTLLAQLEPQPVVVAAPRRSPLAGRAGARQLAVLHPDDPAPQQLGAGTVLVDDAEAFADTAVGAALEAWLAADQVGSCAVVAARADAAALAFRGLVAQVRPARCGVLLHPGPLDGELLGVSLPRVRPPRIPGRGVLIPDPAWNLGVAPLPIQVARS